MEPLPDISLRIFEAVLAKKLPPGARLGEQHLAEVFGCSRTVIREALTRLAARGIVTVSARRGWFVVDLSEDETREAFEARQVIETGLLRFAKSLSKAAIQRLRDHLQRQQTAIDSDDIGLRSFLLGDFHVCLAECLGNGLLAGTLRDFTALTTLSAIRYQSEHNAGRSFAEHVEIVDALAAGEFARAEQLLAQHLGTWQAKLPVPIEVDPVEHLRRVLVPLGKNSR